ncbi:MDR family MFS transporter [Sorangium sp. So ce887]|uniref:MDR family MFS transporter n=1 Tax=Sorangium sp. So ce887 TaxID=3133324 RepID=UPI003F5D8A2B
MSQLLMNMAAFVATPFITIYLGKNLRFSPAEVGTIVSAMMVSGRLLQILTGPIADRVGGHSMMIAGLLLRAAGFAGFAFLTGWWELLFMTLLAGVGDALYEPSVNGTFAAQPAEIRPRVFMLRNQFLNIGVVIGPMLGAALVGYGIRAPFLSAAACFVALCVLLAVVGPLVESPERRPSVLENYRAALRHRPFLAFWGVMVLWWMLFSQLFVSLPVKALEIGGSERWVSTVFLVNGVIGTLAILLVHRLNERLPVHRSLLVGIVLAGLGLGFVPLFPAMGWLLACVLIYTLGESITQPCADVMVAGFADARTGATFFGLYSGSYALGVTLGNYLGSWLVLRLTGAGPWLVYGAIGALGALGVTLYNRRFIDAAKAERALAHP